MFATGFQGLLFFPDDDFAKQRATPFQEMKGSNQTRIQLNNTIFETVKIQKPRNCGFAKQKSIIEV